MPSCKYNNPDFISRYYDNVLSQEERKAFERHLLICDECMTSLLNLQRDLFLIKHNPLPSIEENIASFLFVIRDGVLSLIKSSDSGHRFIPVSSSPIRGENRLSSFEFKKEGITVTILPFSDNSVSLHVEGVMGKTVTLWKEKKLIQAHNKIRDDMIVIDDIPAGKYIIKIEQPGTQRSFSVEIKVDAPL